MNTRINTLFMRVFLCKNVAFTPNFTPIGCYIRAVMAGCLNKVTRHFFGFGAIKAQTANAADQFKDLISKLMRMEDIIIEVIGYFVWVTGNTKPYKEQLKSLKFQWHSKKIACYLKPEDYRKRTIKLMRSFKAAV